MFEGQDRVLTERPSPPTSALQGRGTTATPGRTDNAVPSATPPSGQQPAASGSPGRETQREILRTKPEEAELKRFIETVRRANPYRLDRAGAIDLPGLGVVPMAGLTVLQATQRLAVEQFLQDFRIKLTLLPLEPVGSDALKPFGYDLFAGSPTTFAPVTDIPVPSEFVVGPGDRLEVQLIGSTRARHSLAVNRDGRIMFPDLGPINVAGLRFEQAKSRIEARVSEQMIGTQAVVSMGDLRSVRVYVLGEAERPGSFTVSSLATITNAILVSGGIKPIGSLRNIQLKRNGQVVKRLDLYDLLLNGDTSGNVRLQPGDVIFIPPVGSTVGVTGEIRRPAIYEIKGENSVAELVRLGGGLTPEADPALSTLQRIDKQREQLVMDVDLTDPQSRDTGLRAGDCSPPRSQDDVFERRPARRACAEAGVGPKPHRSAADGRDPVRRRVEGERRPSVRTDSTRGARHEAHAGAFGRSRCGLACADFSRQPSAGAPRPYLCIRSREWPAGHPGPDTAGVEVAGGERRAVTDRSGLGPSASTWRVSARAGHDRQRPDSGRRWACRGGVRRGGGSSAIQGSGRAVAQDGCRQGDLGRALSGELSADLALAPFDFLVIKEISQWTEQETVRLEGQVRFPGEYPIEQGETLSSVIARAGGLTPLAFPQGSVFTRESLKERERRQVEILTDRLKQDLGTLALQAAQASGNGAQQASETLAIGQSLLLDLRNAVPVGRLVIDLDRSWPMHPDPLVWPMSFSRTGTFCACRRPLRRLQ